MWMIAYVITADYTNDYLHIGDDTTLESIQMFAKVIIRLFGPTYIWSPNEDDTK
jgi:hypothetical protein